MMTATHSPEPRILLCADESGLAIYWSSASRTVKDEYPCRRGPRRRGSMPHGADPSA